MRCRCCSSGSVCWSGGWRRRSAFGPALAAGWLFGIGYFSAGLYWLGLPVVIDVPGDLAGDLLLAALGWPDFRWRPWRRPYSAPA